MMAAFSITTAVSETALGAGRQGQVAFTVTNTAGRDLVGRARVVTEAEGQRTWFTLAEPERALAADATQQVRVEVAVPVQVPAGEYRFRLDVLDVEDPDEDPGQGPWTTLAVSPIAPPRRLPWRWIGVAAAAVVVLAVVLFLLVFHHPSQLAVAAGSVRFGTVRMGQGSAASVFTVTNTGSSSTAVSTALSGNDPQDFHVIASTCGGAGLPPGASCQVQVAFVPTDAGSRSAVLRIRDGSGAGVPEMTLSGRGQNTVVITFDPATVALGNPTTAPGLATVQTQLRITNTGVGSLRIGTVRLEDTTSTFRATSGCENVTLSVGRSCQVTIVFSTTTITPQVLTARLLVTDDQPDSPQVVNLSGYRGEFLIARVP
jgi:P pilus assembly chaperone PapD